MQAQHAPRYGADPERRPQLITEADWRQDVAVPGATLRLIVRRLVQTLDGSSRTGQVDELGDIVLEELVGQERGSDRLRDLLRHGAGEQQRGRVDGGAEGGIDRNDLAQPAQHFNLKGVGIEACLTQPNDRLLGSSSYCALVHGCLPSARSV